MPFGHLMGLMSMPLLADQIAPLGNEYGIYAATGILPYILFLYPARMTMLCLVDSMPLLSFPVVKPVDVIAARVVVEAVVAFTVILLFLLVLAAIGLDVWPYNIEQATAAVFSTVYLSVSFGVFSAVAYRLVRSWLWIQITIMITMYLTSGAFYDVRMLSPEARAWLGVNPLFHCVQWLRAAYYEGYGDELLNRQYLLGFATLTLLLGLAFERFIRGRLLQT
jgi:capsular polysaccharide transport system permease protein